MNDLQLRDIHLPDVTLWWPPAPGWWLLVVGLPLLISGLVFLRRWIKHQSAKKRSLIEFRQIIRNFEDQQDSGLLVSRVSTLLRRILMTYQGRDQVAGIAGERWIDELNDLVVERCFSDEQERLLRHGQFQRNIEFDSRALIDSCERWIKALPRSQKHASA